MVGHVIEITLDAVWGFQAAKFAKFGGGESVHLWIEVYPTGTRKALTTEDTGDHRGIGGSSAGR